MSENLILTFDLGTTGCKTAILKVDGSILASDYYEYPIIHPRPDWAEQDPEVWWKAITETAKKVISETDRGEEIAAVVATGQREGVVPVDKNLNTLSNCIIWMDKRTLPQVEKIRKIFGKDYIFEKTGLVIDPIYSLSKILWIKENQKELYEKSVKLLQATELIMARFSGRFVTEPSVASRTMMLDIEKRVWSEEIAKRFDIDLKKFPEIIPSGSVIGKIRPEVANILGISRNAKIITGGGDHQTGALGAGAVELGAVSLCIGTAGAISIIIDHPLRNKDSWIPCCAAVLPDAWELEPNIYTMGALLRWFRDELGRIEVEEAKKRGKSPYIIMDEEVEKIAPGSEGIIALPYFMGASSPLWDPDARGLLFGLSLGHKRGHILKALMEGTMYEVYYNLEAIRKAGIEVKQLYLSGGGAKGKVWPQILADVTGHQVIRVLSEETPSLGIAMLACHALGRYNSIEKASQVMSKGGEIISPDLKNHKKYTDYFKIYQKLYFANKKIFAEIARLKNEL